MATIKKDTRTKKQQQDAFLKKFEALGNITQACNAAKIPRYSVYRWKDTDQKFKTELDEAIVIAIDMLEDEAQRRAFHGVKKPVFQGGKKVGDVTEYSDHLLMFLLKAKKPEVYKERHEHTGKDGGPIEFEITLQI